MACYGDRGCSASTVRLTDAGAHFPALSVTVSNTVLPAACEVRVRGADWRAQQQPDSSPEAVVQPPLSIPHRREDIDDTGHVEFEVTAGQKGPQAANVRPL